MRFNRSYLLRLIGPLVVEQILAVTIGMVDTIMVAASGEAAVSGISLVDGINILVINIFAALATGGAVVASQYIGKGDHDKACLSAKQLVLTTGALSVIVMCFCLLFRDQLLHLIFGNVESDVMGNCQIYLTLTALSYPFIALYNSGAALYRAMGNSKISMVNSLIMNGLNIIGNAILIYGLQMSVTGAGISTLVSRIVGSLVILYMLHNKVNQIYVDSYLHLGFQPKIIKNILSIGVPTGLENGMFQMGKLLVQGLVASFGTTAIAANAVANNIASLEIIPGAAIGLATVTVVGQCVGAKEYEQAKKYGWQLLRWAYIAIIVLNLSIILCVNPLLSIYNLSSETTELAFQLLMLHGVCCSIFWPASFTLPNALRAASDAKFTMSVSIVSMWICRVGCSYLFAQAFGLGVFGVWMAMIADWICRGSFFLIRFHRGKWIGKATV